MTDARADIIRVLHQAYVDNGWMPPTLDGYADALMAAGYGKVDGDADKVRAAAEAVSAAWDSFIDADDMETVVAAVGNLRAALTEPSA